MMTLAGRRCHVEFDGRVCTVDFTGPQAGIRRAFGRLAVPVRALSAVEHEGPRWLRRGRITLLPRPGADPFRTAAGGRLPGAYDPLTVEFTDGPAGEELAEALRSAIATGGLEGVHAAEFLIEPPRQPPAVRGEDCQATYDGTAVWMSWSEAAPSPRPGMIPLTALHGAGVTTRRGEDKCHLRFEMGAAPDSEGDLARVRLSTGSAVAQAYALAGRVLFDLQAASRELTRPLDELPHGLKSTTDEAGRRRTIRLEGLGGWAEFDGTWVTVNSQAMLRRIPLFAIETVDLVEAGDDVGHLRVRLLGLPDDPAAFISYLDVDTVRHRNDPAALEFAHEVTMALRGAARKLEPSLVATAGTRADVAAALARASYRARGLHRELGALAAVLDGDEAVRELDLGLVEGETGLLVLTGARLLFLSSSRPIGDPRRVHLTEVRDATATWGDDWNGALRVVLREGELLVTALHNPDRFRDALLEEGPVGELARPGTGSRRLASSSKAQGKDVHRTPAPRGAHMPLYVVYGTPESPPRYHRARCEDARFLDAGQSRFGPVDPAILRGQGSVPCPRCRPDDVWMTIEGPLRPAVQVIGRHGRGRSLAVVEGACLLFPGTGQWIAVIENTERSAKAVDPRIEVVAHDADGQICWKDSGELKAGIPPGGRAALAFGSAIEGAESATHVEFRAKAGNWRRSTARAGGYAPFGAENVRLEKAEDGRGRPALLRITGQVVNPNPGHLERAAVTGLVRDGEGRLRGGGTCYVRNPHPPPRERFQVDVLNLFWDPAATGLTGEIIVNPGRKGWDDRALRYP